MKFISDFNLWFEYFFNPLKIQLNKIYNILNLNGFENGKLAHNIYINRFKNEDHFDSRVSEIKMGS